MKELTKAEEQLMQVLWNIKEGNVKSIIDCYRDPKPKYTTISTIVRILEKKGFIGHKVDGKSFNYYPLIDKQMYTRLLMKRILSSYFGNSIRQLMQFISHEKSLSASELEELRNIIEDEIRKQREGLA